MAERTPETNRLPRGDRPTRYATPTRLCRNQFTKKTFFPPKLVRQSTLGNPQGQPFTSPELCDEGRHCPGISPGMVGRESGVVDQLRQERYTRLLSEAAFENFTDYSTEGSDYEEVDLYSIPVIRGLRFN